MGLYEQNVAEADQLGYLDQLNIETPEQVDLRFPIAGVGSRFIAHLLDVLLQVTVYLLLALVLAMASAYPAMGSFLQHRGATAQKWLLAGFILLNFLMTWGYFVLFEALWNGQTPGKHLMKLRVLKDSGRSITLFESMTRNLLRIVDYLPGMYLAGVITMICNKANKRLGDFAAGTIVIHERLDEQPILAHSRLSISSASQPDTGGNQRLTPRAEAEWVANETLLPADAVARLGTGDLHVIETFFARALDLSVAKRDELAARLAGTMCSKMQIPMPEGLRPERVLELIVHRMRSQGRG